MNPKNDAIKEAEGLKNYLSLFHSGIVQKLFLSLGTEEKSVKDLYEMIRNKSRAKINEYLNKLEGLELVKKGVSKKALTPTGKIIQIKFREFINLLTMIKKHETYLNKHLINIPDEFLSCLHVFHDSEFISNSVDDDAKVLKTIENATVKGKHFYAIISGYSENYRRIIENILKDNGNVEIIMSKNLYVSLSEENKKEIKRMKDYYKDGRLYLSEDVDKFTILFTDEDVFLFLFKNDGNIEWNECLHSKNKDAVIFARKIFEFYREKSINA